MIIPRKTNQENKQNRPRIRPEMGPLDWLLEISSMIIIPPGEVSGHFRLLLFSLMVCSP